MISSSRVLLVVAARRPVIATHFHIIEYRRRCRLPLSLRRIVTLRTELPRPSPTSNFKATTPSGPPVSCRRSSRAAAKSLLIPAAEPSRNPPAVVVGSRDRSPRHSVPSCHHPFSLSTTAFDFYHTPRSL